MSTVRNTILNNLKTALEGITVFNGYNNDIQKVTRDANNTAKWNESDKPAIWIADNAPEERLTPVGTDARRTMLVQLLGFVEKYDDLSAHFNDFLADVRKLIHSADLGSNVIEMILGESDSEIGENQINFLQIVQITYYYPEASP